MPRLIFTSKGEERSEDVGDSLSIGRAEGNTIALPDEAGASRRHCQIVKLARSYELTDLGSTNGTKVNGRPIKRHALKHGDRIEIGETMLRFSERAEGDVDVEDEISLDEPAGAPAGGKDAPGGQCYLVFAGGDEDGQRVALDKARVTFGRKSSNMVTLESAAVSGFHCEIAREGGAYVLRDLGSTNGTLLDGEPVTEIALQHGGRIRIGNSRLVFVDPAVSDFEKAMAQVDDLGTEWGMLRAEMDMSRVQKARRSQIVAVLAIIVLVGGAGAFVVMNPDLLSDKGPQIAEVEGNMAPDFSFEELGGGWSVVTDSPATARFEEGDAQQGSSYYSVSRDGPRGAPAAAELSGKDITISPGKAYEFGAHMRAKGGGQAAVRILWTGAGEGAAARYSATKLTSGSGWTEVRATAVAPSDARAARLQLLNAADGTAHFDDVVLRPAAAAAKAASSKDGSLEVTATADGRITISRDGTALLDELAVTGGILASEGQPGRPDRMGSASVSAVSASEGGVRVAGQVYDVYGGEMGDFDVTVTAAEGRYAKIDGTLPAGAALVGIVPAAFMEDRGRGVKTGIGVWTSSGSFRETETRYVASAQGISIGTLKRFKIEGGGAAAFPFALFSEGGGFALALGAGEGGLALSLDTDTRALDEELDRVRREAEDAEASGRFGTAIEKWGQYAGRIPEGDPRRVSAQQRVNGLTARGEQELATLRRLAVGALEYREAHGLVVASDGAKSIAEQYDGQPVATGATQVLEQLSSASAERQLEVAEAAAGPVLRRAEDFASIGRKVLAAALYEDVVMRFPGTQAAATARKALQGGQ
jgi:pSer/pThr/pTyr-binding forkhead associated (FHA) protein